MPFCPSIEFGEIESLLQEIVRPGWDRFVGFAEEARTAPYQFAARHLIPFWPEEVGSWWSAKAQIDVVAVQRERRSVLVGEARWRRQPMNLADLETLQTKARQWLGDERGWDLWFALFSCDGFSAELEPPRCRRYACSLHTGRCCCTNAIAVDRK